MIHEIYSDTMITDYCDSTRNIINYMHGTSTGNPSVDRHSGCHDASSRIKRGTTFMAISYKGEMRVSHEALPRIHYRTGQTDEAYLLEQQLCSVRNRQLCHMLGALAIRAPTVVSHQPALLACIHLELVRRDHQPFYEELRRTVTNEAIALHLAQAKASFPRPTFRRLSRQRRTWSAVRHHRSRFSTVIEGQNGSAGYAPRTGMHLVHDHVF